MEDLWKLSVFKQDERRYLQHCWSEEGLKVTVIKRLYLKLQEHFL